MCREDNEQRATWFGIPAQRHPVDALVEMTEDSRVRDSHGRFTKASLARWRDLLRQVESAEQYLVDNGAELLTCRLTTRLGGQTFVATYDGNEWTVEVLS